MTCGDRTVQLRDSTVRLELIRKSSSLFRVWVVSAVALFVVLELGCTNEPSRSGPTIRIGASLPFSGKESAVGRNLEQALLLAVEDVNLAGGIDGVPLELISSDSNSGSERGFANLQTLINSGEISYLIGPEEDELARAIVADVTAADVLNILPGYAAPLSLRATSKGAWMHLAPATVHLGCAFAGHAAADGATTANTLSTPEDFNVGLASYFLSQFRAIKGQAAPSVTVQPDQSSYASSLQKVFGSSPDRTLLIAYPATAANIVTEWDILDEKGNWYLSPLLRTEAFLLNIPYGALDGTFGMSPSLSLRSECELLDGYTYGAISCKQDNAHRFIEHFSARWGGTKPFPAAHLYYDAVVLLALGMQYGASQNNGTIPGVKQLHKTICDQSAPENDPAYWYDISTAFEQLIAGKNLRYVGAGAEYKFTSYGLADHIVFDGWTIRKHAFVNTGSFYAKCWMQDF
jgi:ABC-type branched-subunit amino acid transport system substrate-binding protein